MPERAPKTITVSPQSELAALIAQASSSGLPLIVDTGDTVYRLDVRPAASADVPAPSEQDPPGDAARPSPADFYRELVERQDVRDILKQLAE